MGTRQNGRHVADDNLKPFSPVKKGVFRIKFHRFFPWGSIKTSLIGSDRLGANQATGHNLNQCQGS